MLCEDYVFFVVFFGVMAFLLVCHLLGRSDNYNERREG